MLDFLQLGEGLLQRLLQLLVLALHGRQLCLHVLLCLCDLLRLLLRLFDDMRKLIQRRHYLRHGSLHFRWDAASSLGGIRLLRGGLLSLLWLRWISLLRGLCGLGSLWLTTLLGIHQGLEGQLLHLGDAGTG